jgi:WS/DGAT/MGAT family acyltransferase
MALERPGLPMHIAGVVIFEASTQQGGPLDIGDLHRLMHSRLARLPRFRDRVQFKRFGLTRAEWIPVARVNLAGHLFHHRLRAPGRPWQLAAMCARIHEELLPRDRPLWQMHLIDGLQDHRQALVLKTHHAIADGIGGMQIAECFFEGRPSGQRRPGRGLPALRFARATPSANAWLDGLVGMAFTAASGPFALASPFNGRVGGGRVFAMATLSMDQIRGAKQRLGVSVDDVLLAAVAGGLHRYFRRSGLVAPHAMRAMLPATTRPPSKKPRGGNHVTAVFIDLPLDSGDLSTCARRIAVSKALLKTVHAGLGMSMLIEAAGWLPAPLHEALVRVAADLPVANLVLSDLPGPVEPRFLLGRRIVACYPMLPLPGTIGVSIAAISMGGTMGVGITADSELLPHPHRLATAIEQTINSFEPALPRTEPRRSVRAHGREAA